MTLTDRPRARPPLPDDAGMNTIRLDLALTRDEIATTIRQLSAKLSPNRLLGDHAVPALLTGLALITVVGSVTVHTASRRARDRKHGV